MRMITDPRYLMWQILASLANGARASTLRASEVRIEGETVLLYCQRRERYAHRKAWHALGAPEAAAMQALLTGPYAALEHARAAGGADYALIDGVRWDGGRLFHVADPHLPAAVAPDALVDPRTWLLLMLGAEGRSGQVLRVVRSDIKVEARLNQLLLHVPGRGKKTGSWLLLARTQQLALAFAMRAGYLARLERAYQARTLRDYPLFPQGPLADGRAPAPSLPPHATVPPEIGVQPAPPALAPMNDRVLNDWARRLEALLGLPRVEGEGLYGWRRAFVTLFNPWEPDARVKDLLTAHATIRAVQHGSTRTQVYLDPLDIPVLLAGQRLLEHVRTAFVRTGTAPDGTTSGPHLGGERADRDAGA
jgi:hypothetical protein